MRIVHNAPGGLGKSSHTLLNVRHRSGVVILRGNMRGLIGLRSADSVLSRHGTMVSLTLTVAVVLTVCSVAESLAQGSRRDVRVLPEGNASATTHEGDLYAVVVGVSKYENPKIPPLRFCHKDARDVGRFLEDQTKLFTKIHVTQLINEKATQKEVKKHLYYELRRAGKDDTVIIFLSGHGADDPRAPGEFFFLTYDSDPDNLVGTAVEMNRQSFIDKLDSERVVLIADACHAGGFSNRGTKSVTPPLDRFIRQFRESQGKLFITSSRADESSLEKEELSNGVFTHFLIEGLRGKADQDRDGIVTLKELYDYVYEHTKNATDGVQRPQMEGRIVGAFPLSLSPFHASLFPQRPPPPPTPQPEPVKEPDQLSALKDKASKGDPEAQFSLGFRYEFGSEVPKDLDEAYYWFNKAGKQGHARAKNAADRIKRFTSLGDPPPPLPEPMSPRPTYLSPLDKCLRRCEGIAPTDMQSMKYYVNCQDVCRRKHDQMH